MSHRPEGGDATVQVAEPAGVAALRRRRGSQEVKFSQVADHLTDFVARNPDDTAVVDRLGAFLARVESIDHDHDAPTSSSLSHG
ncbi:MAG TPA: DUF6104 family protein [Acidimicrobiales bacterium]|nr:DUF6104 family protein [Acidimicrobiales bacterium]